MLCKTQVLLLLQVLRYLKAFASVFELHKYIHFDTEVTSAVPIFPKAHAHQYLADQSQTAADGGQSGTRHAAADYAVSALNVICCNTMRKGLSIDAVHCHCLCLNHNCCVPRHQIACKCI